jgi:deoxyribonuclease-4
MTQDATTRWIGGHVSAAGGVDKAVERVAAIGGNIAQVFSGSPRIWKRTPLDLVDTAKLSSEQQKYAVGPIITHAIYLANLASDKPEQITKSMVVLKHDLEFDSLVKGSGVVVHLGSHQGRGWEAVRDQVGTLLVELIKQTPATSRLLIENSAGQQGKLCSDLAEIRWLFDFLEAELGVEKVASRFGWCMDTCHASSAGYALGPEMLSTGQGRGQLVEQAISEHNLWSHLKVIHVNDSRDLFASGRDRHANLGEGTIPAADFTHFLNLPQVRQVPLILEVPGLDGNGPDAENINRLKALLK